MNIDIKTLIPNASESTKRANPHLYGDMGNDLALGRGPTSKNALQTPPNAKKRGSMNKTETEFSLILEAQKNRGEILRWEREGVTLRWNGVSYTPDFVVFGHGGVIYDGGPTHYPIRLIEIKGGYRKMPGFLERAVERFRHAKSYWPEFEFQLWQKKDGWKQLI